MSRAPITVAPLTPERWADLEAVFQARGCSFARTCWCMEYRIRGRPAPPPGMTRADANRRALQQLAGAGRPPGLVGYRDATPVGWISLGPREDYARLARSPVMKPVDDAAVWSIICFVVPSPYRGQGVAHALLAGAVDYARGAGAAIVEAYPIDRPTRSSPSFLWFGPKSLFDQAGFIEVARRKPERPVMRLEL